MEGEVFNPKHVEILSKDQNAAAIVGQPTDTPAATLGGLE